MIYFIRMSEKIYDLENRTLEFSKKVRGFVKSLPKTISNQEYIRQLIRSSASVGANYIEANESLGKKDFLMHVKISREESKETAYWLHLIETDNSTENQREILLKESIELMRIFSAIMRKSAV